MEAGCLEPLVIQNYSKRHFFFLLLSVSHSFISQPDSTPPKAPRPFNALRPLESRHQKSHSSFHPIMTHLSEPAVVAFGVIASFCIWGSPVFHLEAGQDQMLSRDWYYA